MLHLIAGLVVIVQRRKRVLYRTDERYKWVLAHVRYSRTTLVTAFIPDVCICTVLLLN